MGQKDSEEKNTNSTWYIDRPRGTRTIWNYVKQRNISKKALVKAQAEFEKEIMKEFKDKPKQLFNYVRAKQKVKLGISRLENEDGNLTAENEKEAVNVLNRFFQSVFPEELDGDVTGLETYFIIDDMTAYFQRMMWQNSSRHWRRTSHRALMASIHRYFQAVLGSWLHHCTSSLENH